ncbi:MAG: phosphonoacetaldehyde reductase [Clostridiales bacterium]|nr:phosphonoacetaldehyde reductase [Clostridiales bacterium]
MNQYYNPVRTIQGAGSLSGLPDVLEEMHSESRRVLVLGWGEKVFQHPVFSRLEKFDVKTCVFTVSNPTVEQLFETYQSTKEFSPDVVVAIGGGSIMDVGKSLCCMYGNEISDEEDLRAYIQNKSFKTPAVRWIGVPTTSGTGSEVTCWATIWDPSKNVKCSIENHGNYAYAALIDPQLTEELPLKLAVSSALDAVAHAAEAYWAKGTNIVSRALALQAIRMIMSHMDDLLCGKSYAHDIMAKGSMLAGLAFSNTKTTACHSISYPLTMHYHIPHGAAVSMLLAPVLELNASGVEDMENLFAALGVDSAQMLRERIGAFLKRSGQPATLQEWNVPFEECASLAMLGMTKGRADNNPVELTVEKIKEILESVY